MKKRILIICLVLTGVLVGQDIFAQVKKSEKKVFSLIERHATPKGGMKVFYRFIQRNLRYPSKARQEMIEGVVVVRCLVEVDGTLKVIKVTKRLGHGCDEEAVRVLKESPPWVPARQRGKNVKQQLLIPIRFRL